MNNKFPKFVFLVLVTSLLAPGLLSFGLIFVYNPSRGGLAVEAADEEPVINCKKQSEIQLPLGITFELGPNELEIPTGQATDKAEYMAEEIIGQIDIILAASEEQIWAARTMIALADGCKAGNCATGCTESTFDCYPYDYCRDECSGIVVCNGECRCVDNPIDQNPAPEIRVCETRWHTCYRCEVSPCSGQACDFGAITATQQRIESLKRDIDRAYSNINRFFKQPGGHKAFGCWWCMVPILIPTPIPVPLGCPQTAWRTEVEHLMDLMEKSRSGDYLFCDIFTALIGRLNWEHRPLGLKDCVVRMKEWEAKFQGQEAFGKLLLSCKDALSAGLLDQCYGQTECEAGAETKYCPKAENYYCCE